MADAGDNDNIHHNAVFQWPFKASELAEKFGMVTFVATKYN